MTSLLLCQTLVGRNQVRPLWSPISGLLREICRLNWGDPIPPNYLRPLQSPKERGRWKDTGNVLPSPMLVGPGEQASLLQPQAFRLSSEATVELTVPENGGNGDKLEGIQRSEVPEPLGKGRPIRRGRWKQFHVCGLAEGQSWVWRGTW